jgi:hypothetical protein
LQTLAPAKKKRKEKEKQEKRKEPKEKRNKRKRKEKKTYPPFRGIDNKYKYIYLIARARTRARSKNCSSPLRSKGWVCPALGGALPPALTRGYWLAFRASIDTQP